jgi:hypothetical protein
MSEVRKVVTVTKDMLLHVLVLDGAHAIVADEWPSRDFF